MVEKGVMDGWTRLTSWRNDPQDSRDNWIWDRDGERVESYQDPQIDIILLNLGGRMMRSLPMQKLSKEKEFGFRHVESEGSIGTADWK